LKSKTNTSVRRILLPDTEGFVGFTHFGALSIRKSFKNQKNKIKTKL
jgi:hypothetical protein